MVLSVTPDPSISGRINIEGVDIDFSISATGTGGTINILAPTYDVDVWMESDPGVANIQWSQRETFFSACIGHAHGFPVAQHMYWEKDHSLKSTTELDAHYLFTTNAAQASGMGFSLHNFFFLYRDTSLPYNPYVSRYDLSLTGSSSITIPDLYAFQMVVYDDDIAYVIGNEDIAGTQYYSVYKVDFSLGTATRVETFDADGITYDGDNYDHWYQFWCGRCKYGSMDRIVFGGTLIGGGVDRDEIIWAYVFDILTDSKVSQEYIDGGAKVRAFEPSVLGGLYQFQDKIVFATVVSTFDAGYTCLCPLFLVNLNTGALSRIDDVADTYIFSYYDAIANSSGIYYFEAQDVFDTGQFRIGKMTLSSFSPHTEWSSALDGDLAKPIYGNTNAFADHGDGSTYRNLTTVTLNPVIGDISAVAGYINRTAVDDENQIVWVMKSDDSGLYGFHYNYGSDRTMTINWDTNPFSATISRVLMLFNGYAYTLMYSPSSGTYSSYLMTPA